MSYTVPSAADLKARYPAFNAVADSAVSAAIADAATQVDVSIWGEADYDRAIMLYAAHQMTMNGLGATNEAQMSGFRSLSIGSLSLTSSSEASTKVGSGLDATNFGRQFKALLRRNSPGILAV